MKIIPVKDSDALRLSELAKDIYREFYLHLWKPGGADWYMNEYAYHPDQIKQEINDPVNLHYFVLDEANMIIGYLKLKTQTNHEDNPLEIERIYLHKIVTGKGIGDELIRFSAEMAGQLQKKSIILKAMDSSAGAIRFYERNGFTVIGSFDLDFERIKPEFKGMVLMEKKLPVS